MSKTVTNQDAHHSSGLWINVTRQSWLTLLLSSSQLLDSSGDARSFALLLMSSEELRESCSSVHSAESQRPLAAAHHHSLD